MSLVSQSLGQSKRRRQRRRRLIRGPFSALVALAASSTLAVPLVLSVSSGTASAAYVSGCATSRNYIDPNGPDVYN
jgi:hypothetical protein